MIVRVKGFKKKCRALTTMAIASQNSRVPQVSRPGGTAEFRNNLAFRDLGLRGRLNSGFSFAAHFTRDVFITFRLCAQSLTHDPPCPKMKTTMVAEGTILPVLRSYRRPLQALRHGQHFATNSLFQNTLPVSRELSIL